ncbi:phage portal protein [Amycolatopsis sp. NPDC049688]|uniref:phage portal protein n=1 Tax=Amycolatopsis sp. NPDC049688 TaxID=3154733 RepID=UPI00342BFC08
MPLPEGGPWPPRDFVEAFETMHTWGAWYSGNPDQLATAYERVGSRLVNHPQLRPSQLRGGVVGTMARWFWGQPIPPGEKRSKLHVPVAADIATTSADLLFSEPITLTSDDKGSEGQLKDLLSDDLHATLLEAAEIAAAKSGVYLRIVWDREVNPAGPWLQAVHPDAAIPEWRYGRLAAVTFVRQLACDAQVVVRHLERHEVVDGKGAILHGVYVGTETDLGKPAPLNEYPETEALADVVDQDSKILTGINQLTAVYIPNIRPNRTWDHLPACAPFGRSDFASTEPLMDAVDEIYTSWMRDLRLAKARIIVPEAYLQDRGPGRGAQFDVDREAYEGLPMMAAADGSTPLTLQQFAIRVEEHERMALHYVGRIVTTSGYSQQTFGLTGDVAVTATEVTARERKSLITRDKKVKYVRPRLAEILQALLKVADAQGFGWKVDAGKLLTVNFPDAVQQDPTSLAGTLAQLEAARAASTETKVRLLHPEWEKSEVDEEVARILKESGPMQVQNPDTFTGDLGDGPPADKPPAGE